VAFGKNNQLFDLGQVGRDEDHSFMLRSVFHGQNSICGSAVKGQTANSKHGFGWICHHTPRSKRPGSAIYVKIIHSNDSFCAGRVSS
jgi:hypothetical protein